MPPRGLIEPFRAEPTAVWREGAGSGGGPDTRLGLGLDARALLGRMEAASDAAGLDFPPSLRAAALAGRPVDDPIAPE